jgi:hypothetical protein
MACFYAMNELGLPLGEYEITGEAMGLSGEKNEPMFAGGPMHRTPIFHKPTGKKSNQFSSRFFTMRVCKDCRASWMLAIKDWFESGPKEKEPVNSGIFVRRNGANVEISEAEWYRDNPGREPVRCII